MIIQIPCDMLALYILQNNAAICELTESECTRLVKAFLHPVLKYRPNAVYLNVCYRRSAVPSEVFSTFAYDIAVDSNGYPIVNNQGKSEKSAVSLPVDIDWVSPYHKALLCVYGPLLRRGIDLCGIAIQIIKASSVPLYLSVRPSDNHGWPGMGTDFLDSNALPGNGRPDHSRVCVQNYFRSYIRELLRNYDPDGIEIDWLRTMPVVPDQMLQDLSITRSYMRSLRNTVSEFGNKRLSVRVYTTVQSNLDKGMDVCGWIADGSVDSITLENFYIPTNYEIPISEWRQQIAQRNKNANPYQLYCGSDWAVSCGSGFNHYMTPSLIRGFASSCLDRGADDIYLFNLCDCNPETTVMLDPVTGTLQPCAEARFHAGAEPWLGAKRYVYVSGCDNRYPLRIPARGEKSIAVYTGQPSNSFRFYLCTSAQPRVQILLNGNPMSSLSPEILTPGYEKPTDTDTMPVRYCRDQFDRYVSYATALKISDILQGYNTFTIKNNAHNELVISWIEVETQ